MPALEPPDTHYLSAAEGWLALGNHAEAFEELDRISGAFREHPDVLELWWEVYARVRNWELALKAARRLTEVAPDRASGWLHQAYATRRCPTGGLAKARAVLQPACEWFPEEPVIPYNLACYAAQLDQLDEAFEWLRKAVKAAGKAERIREMAEQDPDLEPLRHRLKEL